MHQKLYFGMVCCLFLVLAACGSQSSGKSLFAKKCQTAADCAPVSCCHASACGLKEQAPTSCEGMMCSQECVPGTMDCGGSCGCQDGVCTATIKHATSANELAKEKYE